MKLELSDTFFKKYTNIKFQDIRQVGAKFHADGQTDMRKLIVAFHNFVNVPKKVNEGRMTIITICAYFYSV